MASERSKTSEKNTRSEKYKAFSDGNPEKMSMQDKLDYFDREIKLLHDFCLKSGYNPREIQKAAEPFLLTTDKSHRQKWMLSAIAILVLGILVGMVYSYDPAYKAICATTRKTAVKLLPFWDWTRYYDMDCLIENPFFIGNLPTEDECETVCEKLNSVPKIENTSMKVIAESYIKKDIPVIVEDGMKDWSREKQGLTIDDLIGAHMDGKKPLGMMVSCGFMSNVRVRNGDQIRFLTEVSRNKVPNYYAHWENCIPEAVKEMRSFYQRPYFLPPMIDISESNWVFVSSNYKGTRPKPFPIASPMTMFMQLQGQTTIILHPQVPCDGVCKPITSVVKQGEIMLWTDLFWNASYVANAEGTNFAIAVGGSFD